MAARQQMDALIYLSRMAHQLSRQELDELNAQFSNSNLRRGLTGVLIVIGDHFLQVLEGKREQINEIAMNISADPRHTEYRELFRGEIDQRAFGEWGMQCFHLDKHFMLPFPKLQRLRRDLDAQVSMSRETREAITTLIMGLPSLLQQQQANE